MMKFKLSNPFSKKKGSKEGPATTGVPPGASGSQSSSALSAGFGSADVQTQSSSLREKSVQQSLSREAGASAATTASAATGGKRASSGRHSNSNVDGGAAHYSPDKRTSGSAKKSTSNANSSNRGTRERERDRDRDCDRDRDSRRKKEDASGVNGSGVHGSTNGASRNTDGERGAGYREKDNANAHGVHARGSPHGNDALGGTLRSTVSRGSRSNPNTYHNGRQS
jgi:hypothetical protein